MKKQMWTRIVSGALAGVMMMTMFAGCDSKKEDDYVEGNASEVSYNTEGKFTTILTAENGNFPEDIAAGDIKVTYHHLDQEAYQKALAEEGDVEESKIKEEDYTTEVAASVDNLTRKDEHTMEITFSDGKFTENIPSSYGIVVNKEKSGAGKQLVASAKVAYINHTLTPNIESVSAFDQDIRLTLELSEGEYADGVSKEDVALSGSFANLTVADLSVSGKNLTMQLTGEIVKDESSNVYLSGGVSLAPSAVVNNVKAMAVYLPVDDALVYLDAAKLTAENGKITVPILLGGYRFTDKAAAGSFQMDGASISGFEKKSDTEGVLTLNVPGVSDKNSAAAALDNKTLTVAADAVGTSEALTVEADLAGADFYPVFDYAEEKDGKYNITLILYANAGTFADTLENGMVSFADDFKETSVVSLTRTGDTTAELKITLPSNGVSVEEMNLNGTVKLAAGALVSRWGDSTAQETSYTREYKQESMGRIFTPMELGQIKDIVGGFGNTIWGTVSSVGGGIVSGASGIYSVLEMVGVIESEKAKLDKIYDAVCEIHNQLSDVQSKLGKIQNTQYATIVGDFYADKLLPISSYNDYAVALIDDAMTDLKNKGITAPGGSSDSDLSAEEWTAYLKELMPLVKQKDDRGYFATLQNYFTKVQSAVVASGSGNILDTFDKYMTFCYNFDTLAYEDRELFRYSIMAELERAYYLLCVYTQFSNPGNASQSLLRTLDEQYSKAGKIFEQKAVVRRTDDDAVLYTVDGIAVGSYSKHFTWWEGDHISFTQVQAEDFISRLHGRTIAEELEKSGLDEYFVGVGGVPEPKLFSFDGKEEYDDYGIYWKRSVEQFVAPLYEKNPKLEWKETWYVKKGAFVKDKVRKAGAIQLLNDRYR